MILENNRKKITIIRIIIVVFVILAILALIIYQAFFNKSDDLIGSNNTAITDEPDAQEDVIFKIDNIFLYSSANALNNSETQKDYWNLSIYQYTDISITIDNYVASSELTAKNLVTALYIDNVNFSVKPVLGTPGLYYKNPNSFGSPVTDDVDNQITGRTDFTINTTNDSIDYTTPSFYADCSNPLTLSYVNSGVDPSLIIQNSDEAVTFDGSLLTKAGTVLSNIQATVDFTIHIINGNETEYTCDVSIQIPLSETDEEENITYSIYDGSYTTTLSDLSDDYNFKEVK